MWTAIHKPGKSDRIKKDFFQGAVVSILLYRCTTWTLKKRLEKKLDANSTRILWVILNKSWKQHPTKQKRYGHLPPITKLSKSDEQDHLNMWKQMSSGSFQNITRNYTFTNHIYLMYQIYMIWKHFVDNIFKRPWDNIFSHIVKWF